MCEAELRRQPTAKSTEGHPKAILYIAVGLEQSELISLFARLDGRYPYILLGVLALMYLAEQISRVICILSGPFCLDSLSVQRFQHLRVVDYLSITDRNQESETV